MKSLKFKNVEASVAKRAWMQAISELKVLTEKLEDTKKYDFSYFKQSHDRKIKKLKDRIAYQVQLVTFYKHLYKMKNYEK